MRLGLCMIVRDEAHNIERCLAPIVDLFDDIVIVDTGSSDATGRLISESFGITPLLHQIDTRFWFNKHAARNLAFERVDADWIFSLDADERVAREEVRELRIWLTSHGKDGCFAKWTTYGSEGEIEDYKLPVFRKGFRSSGLVHENIQHCMREAGGEAGWTELLELRHYPDPEKAAFKRQFYKQRLLRAVVLQPGWFRYHWFLGYALFRDGEEQAAAYLEQAAASRSRLFPVECLNAHLVLAQIHALRGDPERTSRVIASARSFFSEVSNDFEVKVNFRLDPWLRRAALFCSEHRLNEIVAYRFSA